MPLQSTSGAASYDAFGGGAAAKVNYIEDFFQSYLRTGTGASATVTTGLDGSTKKTLVWTKSRSAATNHKLTDNVRGATKALSSNTTGAEATDSQGLTAFSATGYTIGTNTDYNNSGATYVDWQWVAQPKFFDVVTWTGTNSPSSRLISHNLGSQPGHIMIKRTDAVGNWSNWHINGSVYREFTPGINSTASLNSSPTATDVATSTSIDVWYTQQTSGIGDVNGATYVAYLFAHNAGGFGLTGTDNVISCGSFTADNAGGGAYAGGATVNLGYEPQFVMFKETDSTLSDPNWIMVDTFRGYRAQETSGSDVGQQRLRANTSEAEANAGGCSFPTSTGFSALQLTGGATYIYIAIRRGPMKVPTSGTSVFAPVARTGTGTNTTITTGFVNDSVWSSQRSGGYRGVFDRLRGPNILLFQNVTSAESTYTDTLTGFDNNTGINVGVDASWGGINLSGASDITYGFRRAPSFFDEVCYTVSGFAANNVAHNLTVTPELFITKPRGSIGGWTVYGSILGATTKYMTLNDTQALQTSGSTAWGATSSTFSEPSTAKNGTYVCYLFATCAGVSKVFSFTGNGSSQTINCGFTGGARWVMIKRTDSTGDWYVWDSARGIVAGNDPHLSLNSTAAEVTTDDSVDTDNTGFIVNQVAATNVNVSSATYIGIAIA